MIERIELVVPWPKEQDNHLIAAIFPFQPMVNVQLLKLQFPFTKFIFRCDL